MTGVEAVEAVRAWAYPALGGHYSALARRVLIVHTGEQVQIWSAWTGSTPKRLLRTHDLTTVTVAAGRRRYVRACFGPERLWVRREDATRLLSWRTSSERKSTLTSMRFDEGLSAHAVASEGEDLEPEYRVSFWSPNGTTWLNEWVGITEADADDVIAWARENASGRHFTVWARTEVGAGRVLDVRLVGAEPHDVNGGWEPAWARRVDVDRGKPQRTVGSSPTD